jgi:hypothetical protein
MAEMYNGQNHQFQHVLKTGICHGQNNQFQHVWYVSWSKLSVTACLKITRICKNVIKTS